mmetsp:Transcript_13545/g.22275  ORF Transcript_13545/g.22275 Transcript_13545/m.22275 type:complete len:261 (+) Transcript_13545:259-1041(+)
MDAFPPPPPDPPPRVRRVIRGVSLFGMGSGGTFLRNEDDATVVNPFGEEEVVEMRVSYVGLVASGLLLLLITLSLSHESMLWGRVGKRTSASASSRSSATLFRRPFISFSARSRRCFFLLQSQARSGLVFAELKLELSFSAITSRCSSSSLDSTASDSRTPSGIWSSAAFPFPPVAVAPADALLPLGEGSEEEVADATEAIETSEAFLSGYVWERDDRLRSIARRASRSAWVSTGLFGLPPPDCEDKAPSAIACEKFCKN